MQFRKFSAIILLVVYILAVQPRQSEAFAPVVIVPTLLGGIVLTTAVINYYKPTTVPVEWPGSGVLTQAMNIGRVIVGAQTAYDQYAQAQLKGNYLAVKASVEKLQETFLLNNAWQTMFPNMKDFLLKDGAGKLTEGTQIGEVVSEPETGKNVQITNRGPTDVSSGTYGWGNNGGHTVETVGQWHYLCTGYGQTPSKDPDCYSRRTPFQWVEVASAPPKACNQIELQAKAPNGVLPSLVVNDLDQMIAYNANGFGISIVDAVAPGQVDNAPPFIPPAVVTSPLDQTAPVIQPGVIIAGNGATANGTVTTAQDRYNTAIKDLADYKVAHPDATVASDPALASLQSAADAAQAALNAAAQTAANANAAENEKYPNAATDALLQIDWTPFKTLSGAMTHVWPFSLLTTVAGYYDVFVKESTPPVFNVPMPLGLAFTIDLAPWDTIAQLCRYLISSIMSAGAILYLVRFWRGVE